MSDCINKLFGYHIYFWSNENYPLDPVHFHISKNPHQNATKVWITENSELVIANNNDRISEKELKRIFRYIQEFEVISIIKTKWMEHFGVITYYC